MPCTLDLKDDEAVKAFVEKVKAEAGRIDVLVNSAYQGLAVTKPHLGKKFYEQPLSTYDDHMSAVRWAYAMSQLVAPSMIEAKSGLIVNISSAGGGLYLFSTPYGVMHSAMDRLAADMGTELKGTGVTAVSLWPGGAVTESTAFPDGETPAFAGRAVAALAFVKTLANAAPVDESDDLADRAALDLADKSGKILMTSELAREYGFVDATGAMPVGSMASGAGVEAQTWIRGMLSKGGFPPFGGELGDYSQTNNEGLAGCFHGY